MADWQESELLTEQERVVVEFADVLSRTPANVSDGLRQRLRQHFSERQLVELANVIAWENARARFNRGLGIEPDGFQLDD